VRTLRVVATAIGCLCIALLVASCGGGGSSSSSTGGTPASSGSSGGSEVSGSPLKIGLVTPLTGEASSFGIAVKNSTELAIDEINEEGGIEGHELELDAVDAGESPAENVNAMRQATSEHPFAITGPLLSASIFAEAPLVERAKIPTFSGVLSPKVPEQGYEWLFDMRTNEAIQGAAVVKYMTSTLKSPSEAKIGVLYSNDELGKGALQIIEETAEEEGLESPVSRPHEAAASNFTADLLAMEKAGVNELYLETYPGPISIILKDLANSSYHPQVWGNASLPLVTHTYSLVPPAVGKGTISAVDCLPESDARPEVKAFVKTFEQKYEETPEFIATWGYDAMKLLKTATEAAGSTEEQAVRDALAEIKDESGMCQSDYTADEQLSLAHATLIAEQQENGELKELASAKQEESGELVIEDAK
jgi:branched-chain amino acid transport system substrate-binding protein